MVELSERDGSAEAVSPRTRIIGLASFGVANQLRIEGHKIWPHLHIRHFVLPQGKHGGKVAVARVIGALVIVAPQQIGNGGVSQVRDELLKQSG